MDGNRWLPPAKDRMAPATGHARYRTPARLLRTARLHVAIIMDGNGRWAKARGLPRTLGHRAGVAALKRTVEAAPDLGVERLTVFGFSTENWRRPADGGLRTDEPAEGLCRRDLERLERDGVRVRSWAGATGFDRPTFSHYRASRSRTARNSRFHLQVAFNYGGRADIVDAARKFARAVEAWRRAAPEDLNDDRL